MVCSSHSICVSPIHTSFRNGSSDFPSMKALGGKKREQAVLGKGSPQHRNSPSSRQGMLDALLAASIPACTSLASACFLCCICFVWKRGPRLEVAPGSLLLCQKSDWCSRASFYLLIISRTDRCPFFRSLETFSEQAPILGCSEGSEEIYTHHQHSSFPTRQKQQLLLPLFLEIRGKIARTLEPWHLFPPTLSLPEALLLFRAEVLHRAHIPGG